MNTPSITCKDHLNARDSKDVSTKMPSVMIKTTEKPQITISTTLLPVKLTTTFTTTSIADLHIKPISNNTAKVNNTMSNSYKDFDEESVSNRKIEHLMVEDEILYTCFKLDYATGITKL